MSRPLTSEEITECIDMLYTEYYQNFPSPMREYAQTALAEQVHKALHDVVLYPAMLGHLKEELLKKFKPIEPGKSIGIITAQSIGEMNTQSTLDSFHRTGITQKTVVSGVPRFNELIQTNHSKTQSDPTCYIFFTEKYPVSVLREQFSKQFISLQLRDLVEHTEYFPTDQSEFTKVFCKVFDEDEPTSLVPVLRYTLSKELMYRYKLTLEEIVQALQCVAPDGVQFIFSPLHLGQIEDSASVASTTHATLISRPICGLEGIREIHFFANKAGEWYGETTGSNLKQVMSTVPFVDTFRTYSTDIWELFEIFGIEAVRSLLIEEFTNIMGNIHRGYIELLADRMTVSGRLKSITRYTRKTEQASVLSKVTFEETLANFSRAAFTEEDDPVKGCSASIVCGKIPCVGSGFVDLLPVHQR